MDRHEDDTRLHTGRAWLGKNRLVLLGVSAWLISISIGFQILLVHDTSISRQPDTDEEQRLHSPVSLVAVPLAAKPLADPIALRSLNELTPQAGQLHVVMALHPRCACTRNTLRELERLLAIDPVHTECTFLVYLPDSEALSWMDTETTRMAFRLPNSTLVTDREAKHATRFGMHNSGETLVIDPNGSVAFRGGITAGRSCVMENPGANAVASLLQRVAVNAVATPTFGCPLN